MTHHPDRGYAQKLDQDDPLRKFRDRFHIPTQENGDPTIYFCGNSLGLQPKGVRADIEQELEDWAALGVEGHFDGRDPWYAYHEKFAEGLSDIVGANAKEIVVMNTLTTNLHLMMVSFYRPTEGRFKILMEGGAFPSDHYALDSQAKFHGFDPEEAVVKLEPRPTAYGEGAEETLRDADILQAIEELGDELAVVMLGGVNYYTGQLFDLEAITEAGHKVGAKVGFDLAHAAGNVPLELHDWGVDFAVWCSYKYLNAGPGATAGCFVHERWADAPDLPRFAGWWGTDPETRFQMAPEFAPQPGAAGWQLSNAPVFSMAPLKASLRLFNEAGVERLREKSLGLTDYLLYLVDQMPSGSFEVITPRAPNSRGSQVSLQAKRDGKKLFDALQAEGVICDWREPDVIRLAPVPLYNSYEDVWTFCDILSRTLEAS
ncbi:MAG: kynureninase [Persicimonas sp.]